MKTDVVSQTGLADRGTAAPQADDDGCAVADPAPSHRRRFVQPGHVALAVGTPAAVALRQNAETQPRRKRPRRSHEVGVRHFLYDHRRRFICPQYLVTPSKRPLLRTARLASVGITLSPIHYRPE